MTSPPEAAAFPVKPKKKKKVRRPILMRISSWLQLAGTIIVVLLVVGLGLTAYSAAQIRVGSVNGGSSNGHTSFGPNVINQSTNINLTNGGFLPITGLSLDALAYIIGGSVVGVSNAPAVTVAGGTTYALPIIVSVSVAPGSPGQQLLVSAAEIGTVGWLNATFGYLLTVSVQISPSNESNWGAPFAGFNVGVTQVGPVATVTVSFSNMASIEVGGTMSIDLTSSTGTTCGTVSGPVDVPSGQPFSGSTTTTFQAGCTAAYALATISGTTPTPYSFTLPRVNV